MVDAPGAPPEGARSVRARGLPVARTLLLTAAASWFVILALPSTSGDPTLGLLDLLHGLAFGLALLAAAQLDWQGIFGIG